MESECNIHGTYDSGLLGYSGCPACEREAERQEAAEKNHRESLEAVERHREAILEAEERRREEAQERAEVQERAAADREEREAERAAQHVYELNNPGTHQCPYCLLVSLLKGARRCPKCHHDVESEYWIEVSAREAAALRQRQEEIRMREEEAQKARDAREAWLRSPEGIAAKEAEVKKARELEAQHQRLLIAQRAEKTGRSLATAGMWFSICSLPTMCILIGYVLAPVGLTLGVTSMVFLAKSNQRKGWFQAIVASLLGSIGSCGLIAVAGSMVSSAISGGVHH